MSCKITLKWVYQGLLTSTRKNMLEVIRSLGFALEGDHVDLPLPLCPLFPSHGGWVPISFTIPFSIALLATRGS